MFEDSYSFDALTIALGIIRELTKRQAKADRGVFVFVPERNLVDQEVARELIRKRFGFVKNKNFIKQMEQRISSIFEKEAESKQNVRYINMINLDEYLMMIVEEWDRIFEPLWINVQLVYEAAQLELHPDRAVENFKLLVL